jgi:hypothetical protein
MVRRLTPKVDEVPIFTASGTCQNAVNDVPEDNVPEHSDVPVDDVPEGDVPELDDVADVPEVGKGWRIEVTNNGRYYQWRKGSHGNRQTKKGGKFSQLDEARKESYERNKEAYQNRRGR